MFMSFLFVSGSVFKAEGEEGPGKPLDKPVPDHSWLFPEYFFTPSTCSDIPQKCLSEREPTLNVPTWLAYQLLLRCIPYLLTGAGLTQGKKLGQLMSLWQLRRARPLDFRVSHTPLVQAGRPAPLQGGSALSLLQDLWPFLMEKPQNFLPALHGTQAPTASLSLEQEWLHPLGIRLRSHLLLQELPGLYTQDIHTSEGASFFRVVPDLNVAYRAKRK